MRDVNEAVVWLESVSVRFRPKTIDVYDEALNLIRMFEQLSQSDRSLLVANVSDRSGKKLLSLSAFLAERAMATREARWLKAAVLLHVIEDFRKDYRENIRYLVLVNYAAAYINARFQDLIEEVLPLASDRAKKHLIDFEGRSSELNELDRFGLTVSFEDAEPRFVQV